MRDTIVKEPYVGFTFNNIHSSQFGLVSATSGDRYSRELLPKMEDYITKIEGGNGSYLFGSVLSEKTFILNLAFWDITEEEYREMIIWLYAEGKIVELILDETPYKKHYVKLSKNPTILYIPFLEEDTRIYKGELELNFISYDPYGYSVYKFLENYDENIDNISEWSLSSKLLEHRLTSSGINYDEFQPFGSINEQPFMLLYNAGDVETDFILSFPIDSYSKVLNIFVTSKKTMTFDFSNIGNGVIEINSFKKTITFNGVNYFDLLIDGDFFQIPIGYSALNFKYDESSWVPPWPLGPYLMDMHRLIVNVINSNTGNETITINIYDNTGVLNHSVSNSFIYDAILQSNKYVVEVIRNGCVSQSIVADIRFNDQTLNIPLYGGDINGDGIIDNTDLVILNSPLNLNLNVADAENPICDFNNDGIIDNDDIAIVTANLGRVNIAASEIFNQIYPIISYNYKFL